MKEWPLIVFTMALQFSCGLTMAATLFEMKARPADLALMRPLALSIFPLAAFGILVSLLHLGRPWLAWKAILNLGHSRLSLEILLAALFVVMTLAYSGLWWTGATAGRSALGVATASAGLVAVVASSILYTVPAQPAWNAGWVPASFLATTLLLGGLAPAVLLSWSGHTGLLRTFLGASVAGSWWLLISAFWMLANLSRTAGDPYATARLQGSLHLLTSQYSLWLGLYIVLVGVIPAAFAFRWWPGRLIGSDHPATPFAIAVFLVVVFAAAVGRALLYVAGGSAASF